MRTRGLGDRTGHTLAIHTPPVFYDAASVRQTLLITSAVDQTLAPDRPNVSEVTEDTVPDLTTRDPAPVRASEDHTTPTLALIDDRLPAHLGCCTEEESSALPDRNGRSRSEDR